jgi:hypothetical protein
MTHSIKLLAILAFGATLAAPAFAQQIPTAPPGVVPPLATIPPPAVARQQPSQPSQWPHNSNLAPDFQLGGER